MRFNRHNSALNFVLFALAALLFLGAPVKAQEQQGPLPGAAPQTEDDAPLPPVRTQAPRQVAAAPAPHPAPARPAAPQSEQISTAPPSLPVDQIIQKFAARETGVQTRARQFHLRPGLHHPDHRQQRPSRRRILKMTSDITFTPEGKRYENDHLRPAFDASAHHAFPAGSRRLAKRAALRPHHHRNCRSTTSPMSAAKRSTNWAPTSSMSLPKRLKRISVTFRVASGSMTRDLEIVKSYGKAVPGHPQRQ